MNEQHIARLEAQLERLVESTFAHLFGKRIRAQDIALQLARAMEQGASNNGTHTIAPDHYVIMMSPSTQQQLLQNQPALPDLLGDYLVELAMNAGYKLSMKPVVEIVADDDGRAGGVSVIADFGKKRTSTTAVMQRVDTLKTPSAPLNPQLIIQGKPAIPLQFDVINIGRSRDNHIVIDDRAVSRYHLQLRLRFGRYALFDTQSQGGTLVNNVRIREHNLQSGDVIQIGNTRLVYMEDRPAGDAQTQINDTVESES